MNADERNARYQENDALIKSRRPMTPDETARNLAAVEAHYEGTPTVADLLVRAATELRYACHAETCVCSATAQRANLALLFVREALERLRQA